MEVMFTIMGFSLAILTVLIIFVAAAWEMEPIDKTFPTGQTLNGGAN